VETGKVGKMKTNDLENELRNLKFRHLTENEMTAYCNQGLDRSHHIRVQAHLKQCFLCERQLELLREERAALANRQTSAEDVAFVERLIEQLAQKPDADNTTQRAQVAPLRERLTEALRQLVANWQVAFAPTYRDSPQGEVVWRWHSADGLLRAYATIEGTDLLVHISSNDMALENARLHFRAGAFNEELTLRRNPEGEVAAQAAIAWPYRRGNLLADVAIEIL
jgi:hypothetical protein